MRAGVRGGVRAGVRDGVRAASMLVQIISNAQFFLLSHKEAALAPAHQHIFGTLRPLGGTHVFNFSGVETSAEILPQIFDALRIAQPRRR